MADASKEALEALKKRAADVNNKIIAATTKKELAQKRVLELLNELGYENPEQLSNEEILKIIEDLEQKEAEKVDKFEKEIEAAEKVLNNQDF